MAADVGSMFRYRTRFDVRRLQMLNVTIIRELSARFLEEEGSQQQDERSLLIGTQHPTLQQNFQRAPVYIYYYRGRLNVKNEEIDEMIKEAPGPINFTVFLTMFGEKLKGADPEETILNAFKVFDPEGKGLKSAYIKEMLMTQGERFSQEEVDQMFAAFPPDISGNLDYKNLVHIITHGEEKD